MLSGSQKLSHRGRDVSSRSSSHVNAVASRLIFTSGSVCLSLLFYFPSQAVSLSFHLLRSMSWMTGVKLNGQGCETNFVCVCVCAHAWVCVHTLASCRWSIAHSALCCPSGTTTSLPACLLSSHNQFCNPTNPHTHAALRFFFFFAIWWLTKYFNYLNHWQSCCYCFILQTPSSINVSFWYSSFFALIFFDVL